MRPVVYDVAPAPQAGGAHRSVMPTDLRAMSRDDLLALKATVEADMANIRLQLERASARFNTEGIPADAEWFARARYALRMKGTLAQQIQNAIAAVTRAERAARSRTPDEESLQQKAFLHAYMRAAKLLLGDQGHAACIAEADAAASRALEQARKAVSP